MKNGEQTRPFGMSSEMGELMASLLLIVDAWYELASESAPRRFQPADRVEVLGHLVHLIARLFQGFRRLPRPDEVRPVLTGQSVGLQIHRPGRAPASTEVIERRLAVYGFHLSTTPGPNERELMVTCHDLAGARILAFPDPSAAAQRRGRRRK